MQFDWSIQASTNLVDRFTVDELKLLRRAGLSQVAQGADSGSPKVMHLMNKDFQKMETIYAAADKLTQAGIRPSFNMIFGFPGEGEKERRESIAADHGHLPQVSGRGVLDQYLHAVSRRARSCSAPSSWASTCRKRWKAGWISSRATRFFRG